MENIFRALEQAPELRVAAGFDGYVDTISRAVKRKGAYGVQFFSTIADFGAHISSKAGKSAGLELRAESRRMGGNLPLYAQALCRLGVSVTAVGALGWPQPDSAFDALLRHERCTAYSVAQPGLCEAVEFDDGKLMLAHNEDIEQLDDAMVRARMPEGALDSAFADCDLAAFLNWSELPRVTSVWKGLAGVLRAPLLVDLSDLSLRAEGEIAEMFALLRLLSRRVPLTLSLNRNEEEQLARGLGIKEEDPLVLAQILDIQLSGARVVLHLTDGAHCACRGGLFSQRNVHIDRPTLSTGGGDHFNAGLTLALLSGLSVPESLIVGNAASGFYVRNGRSPDRAELKDFLREHERELS